MKIILLVSMFYSFFLYAEDAKIYSQKQFDEEVDRRLKEEVSRIKQKGVVELTNEILDREASLKNRERELIRRQEEYELNLKDFSAKVLSFDKRQNDFLSCVSQQGEEKESRVSRMVKVISGMKPDKAAALISEQDPDISVKILSLLEPEKTSKIFNMMEKEKSALLQKRYLDMKR